VGWGFMSGLMRVTRALCCRSMPPYLPTEAV
jgi:hypothetical protein